MRNPFFQNVSVGLSGAAISITAQADGTTRVYHTDLVAVRYSTDGGATWSDALAAINGEAILPTAPGDNIRIDPVGYLSFVVPNSTLPIALVLINSNSHGIGRVDAEVGDAFVEGATQWTQAATHEAISGAVLDVNDTSGNYESTHFSPMVSFAEAVMASGKYGGICFVPDGMGATGFSDGVWSPDPADHPNRLTGAVERWNAAYAALVADGNTVHPLCAIFLNANPDASLIGESADPSIATMFAYTNAQDAYVDYVRSHLDGVDATFPVLVSNAMTEGQIGSSALFEAASAMGTSIQHRVAHAHSISVIYDRGDGEAENLPITRFDSFHADHAGELTKGRLLYAALDRAIANDDPRAPFTSLPFYDDIARLYDYRSGSLRNWITRAEDDLTAIQKAVLLRHDEGFGTTAHVRPAGTGRVLKFGGLAAQYTISLRLRLDSVTKTAGLCMNVGIEHRFFLHSSGNIRCGHSTPQEIEVAGDLVAGQIYQLTLTFDGTTMTLYRDAVALASAPAAPTPSGEIAIGAGDLVGANAFTGDMQSVLTLDRALTAPEVAALAGLEY